MLTNLITLLHNYVSHEFSEEKKPFCEFIASALLALEARSEVIIRGWGEPGYIDALQTAATRELVLKVAEQCGDELWKGKNQRIRTCGKGQEHVDEKVVQDIQQLLG